MSVTDKDIDRAITAWADKCGDGTRIRMRAALESLETSKNARIRELEAAIAKIAKTERRNLTPGHRLTEIYRIAFDVVNPDITA